MDGAPTRDRPAARTGWPVFGVIVLLVAAGIIAYHNSFSGVFVFDDLPGIRDNLTIRNLGAPLEVLSPPANSGVGGRPLANLSFAVNHALGGTDVRGYHAVNLLLHLGSALLLFGIVRRTLRTGGPALAGAVALLWEVHPLTTATVSYLSQRTEALMAFFYLLTLYAFIRGTAAGSDGHRRKWLTASVVTCAFGMISKEVMGTAPLVVWLYDRIFVAGSFAGAWKARRGYYVSLTATWIVLGYLLTTGLHQRSVGFGLGVSPLHYALTECRAVVLYLRLALWPSPLVFDYGAIYAGGALATAVSAAALGLLAGWTVHAVRRGAAAGFAVASFFLLLAPTSSVVPVAEQPIAENRMYLPLAALAALLVPATMTALRGRSRMAALAVAGGFGVLTFARNTDYHSEFALWSDTVRKRPGNSRAHFNCGVVLLDAGRAAEATSYFEAAIHLNPREPKAHNSLGNALLELDRVADALPHFAAAVRLEPHYARGWYNYGTALFRQGDVTGAVERFEQALRIEPRLGVAHNALGNAFFHQNQPAQAIEHYETALRIDPALADAHYNCGSACLELGRNEAAVAHFAAAAQLKPQDPEIRINHGAALFRVGRINDAIAQFEHALRLKPDYPEARDNLALARAEFARTRGR